MSEPSPTAQSDSRQSPDSPPTSTPATQQGRPRREGNDSLWKRARRTLGTNSLTFLQPQSRPTPGPKSDDASAPGTGPAAPSKRREQVRHAQRTHRQRTQNYIKTLESEVVRLRGSESNLMEEKDKLQGQVEILRTTLIFSNIPLPPGIDPPTTTPSHTLPSNDPEMATVSYRIDDSSHQRLHVNWMAPASQNYPQMAQGLPQRPLHTDHSPGYRRPAHGRNATNLPDDLSLQQLNFVSSPYDQFAESDPEQFTKVDSPEIAIEFVLALEHPCMTHLPHPTGTPSDDPSNHILLASTPLVSSAPQPPQPNTSWSWTANSSIIKELLNLSSSINLEGEITPVEAWHRLRQHPDFWRLTRMDINHIKNDLSSAVRCCGFGAVLDEQIFLQTLDRYLSTADNTYSTGPL